MYYLRKEPYEVTFPEIKKIDGSIIPEKTYMTDDRALYKSTRFSRFYRMPFAGIGIRRGDAKLYTCKKLKTILEHRKSLYDYCGEWFDMYDEFGKVNIENT